MNKKMSATGALAYLIYVLETNLSELASAENKTDYIAGSWEACIECLEIIRCWKRAKAYGLDYDPEIKYKLFNRGAEQCFFSSTKPPRRKK